MVGRQRVIVDIEKCIGSGMCALTAPAVFSQDENGFVVLLDQAATNTQDARSAAELCPSGALTLDLSEVHE
jgi:ferredoxin